MMYVLCGCIYLLMYLSIYLFIYVFIYLYDDDDGITIMNTLVNTKKYILFLW